MAEKLTFKDLGLSEKALKAIHKKGFEEPTDIQAMTIPVMLKDQFNIIAQAQTGTGKTAAFGLPLLDLIDENLRDVQALILVPTRELAIQVSEEINSLKGDSKIEAIPIYGGQAIDQQLSRLRKGVQIVVGTPGRIIDHLKRGTLLIDQINHLILDEADEMLNMGFVEDMEEIFKHTSEDKRTLLFSATMPKRIQDLAKKYMTGYEHLVAKNNPLTTSLTEQIYFEVKHSDKFEALCRIIDIEPEFYGMVFCRTKNDVDSIVPHLKDRGYDAEGIHGDISQAQREKILGAFKKKKITILIATDVAARGIDVNDLTHVINYSLPQDAESYVHRIGRTGRAGKQGTAITFITPSEYSRLMFFQKHAKADIKRSTLPKIDEVIEIKRKKIHEDLQNEVQKTEAPGKKYFGWAEEILGDAHPAEVLGKLLKYFFDEELNPESYDDIRESSPNKQRPLLDNGKTRLFVALGKKDQMTPKKLVGLVTGKSSIESKYIDDVQVMENFSFITVPFPAAEQIIQSFREEGQRPLVTHVKNEKGGSGGGERQRGRDNIASRYSAGGGGAERRPSRSRSGESKSAGGDAPVGFRRKERKGPPGEKRDRKRRA
jgi:ATP-dependent RNA helicase DeaD